MWNAGPFHSKRGVARHPEDRGGAGGTRRLGSSGGGALLPSLPRRSPDPSPSPSADEAHGPSASRPEAPRGCGGGGRPTANEGRRRPSVGAGEWRWDREALGRGQTCRLPLGPSVVSLSGLSVDPSGCPSSRWPYPGDGRLGRAEPRRNNRDGGREGRGWGFGPRFVGHRPGPLRRGETWGRGRQGNRGG